MRLLITVFSLLLLAGCAAGAGRGGAAPHIGAAASGLLELYRARDYFTLRERLAALSGADSPELRFLRAAVEQAFNRPAESAALAERALARGGLPDSLRLELERIQLDNQLRLFQYARGAATAERIVAEYPAADSAVLDDVRNLGRALSALRDVPPQRLVRHAATRVGFVEGRVPVVVNDSARHYVFDTGANLSTVMRSEARALGMRIRPAGIDVGTSTDQRVTADVAVAERVAIGGLELRDVVFLVMDDELLTFPGLRIPGIIGFPVIEAMGEIRRLAGDTLEVPGTVPRRTAGNLALQQLSPLTTVGWRGDTLICQLDTGANRTQFYEPFLRRYRADIQAAGQLDTIRTGGAGGVRRLEAYRLRRLPLTVGDTTFVLDSASVLTRSIARTEEENYLHCNLGHDVLDAFGEYVLNFRDMAFLLRGAGGGAGR